MKTLQESDILRIFQEEWQKRVDALTENVLSPELKLLHKKSKLLYTIDAVGVRDVILRNPEGEKFLVNKSELESEYELK